jgi:hypothetical protein
MALRSKVTFFDIEFDVEFDVEHQIHRYVELDAPTPLSAAEIALRKMIRRACF